MRFWSGPGGMTLGNTVAELDESEKSVTPAEFPVRSRSGVGTSAGAKAFHSPVWPNAAP